MANPQAEDGHIDIANEIAEALAKTNLSAYQSRILWVIWRKTYGYHKKSDWISNSQMVELTGISKGHVSRTLKELTLRNIVTHSGNKVTDSGNKIAFNKDYSQWRELPKGARGYQFGQKVTNSGKKVTNSGGHKRKLTKENIQKKKNIYVEQARRIFEYWKKRTGKKKAFFSDERKHISFQDC